MVEEPATSALRRAVIDAYDRLAERILHRLREVREDMDADLSELRSEMSALRQSVEDVGDRVQLRQVRASIDELRTEVTGLRRAVLDWPELERISADVTSLRADIAGVVEAVSAVPLEGSGGTRVSLSPIVKEVAALRAELGDVAAAVGDLQSGPSEPAMLDAITELREEIASLRRRISLRAGGPHPG